MAVPAFGTYRPGLDTSAEAFVAVTPNDGADLPDGVCRALWVGGAGNISIDDATAYGHTAVVLKNVSGLIAVRAKRVRATSTTATDIVALY